MNTPLVMHVSEHAVEQFRARIARLSETEAQNAILTGIAQAENVKILPDGDTLRVRTRRPFPYEFRAYCVFDHDRGHFVVTTIVRGDSCVTRKQRRRAKRHWSPPEETRTKV